MGELLETELWQSTLKVYAIEVEGIRLDSTTTYGYHTPREDGLMQYGHSKDHRPDQPQLKLMAAAAKAGIAQCEEYYRRGWCLEHGFHLLKDKPLGIRPLYVRKDDQILGLTRLLTLGARLLKTAFILS